MARPIGITPTLYGKDGIEFLKRMEQGPTEKDKEYNKKLAESAKKRRVHFLFNDD